MRDKPDNHWTYRFAEALAEMDTDKDRMRRQNPQPLSGTMTGSDVFHVLVIGRSMINGGRESSVLVTTGLEFLASVGARAEVSHGDRVRLVPRGSIYPSDRWGTITGHEVMRVMPDDDGPVEVVDRFGLCGSGRWARASELH